MKNKILKPLVIAIALVLLPLSISNAQSTQTNQGQKGDKGDNGQGSFIYSNTCGGSGTKPCKIGTIDPGGGWIFFVDYNDQYPGFTYLEAAPTDIAAAVWCDQSNISISKVGGWTAKGVGKGRVNTKAMLEVCTSGAANSADTYSTPTAPTGWFLPSLGEAKLMYDNLLEAGVGGFAFNGYWSSTELDSNYAWIQYFYNGLQIINFKYTTLPARAVRAF